MNFLRRLSLGLCGILLGFSVTALIVISTANQTILKRETVKHWLQDGNAYQNFVNETLTDNQKQLDKALAGNATVTPEVVTEALRNTFSAPYVQQKTELVIDEAYDWLEQKDDSLDFNVTLQDKLGTFKTELQPLIMEKLAALPPCPPSRALTLEDAVNGHCLPVGTNVTDLSKQLTERVSEDSAIFSETIEPEAVTESQSVEPAQATSNLPGLVSLARMAPFVLWPIVALTSVAIFFLASTKRRGVRAIGVRVLLGSVLLMFLGMLMALYGTYFSAAQLSSFTPDQSSIVAKLVDPVVRIAFPEVGYYLGLYGFIASIIGTACIVGSYFGKKKVPATAEAPPPQDTPPYPPAANPLT